MYIYYPTLSFLFFNCTSYTTRTDLERAVWTVYNRGRSTTLPRWGRVIFQSAGFTGTHWKSEEGLNHGKQLILCHCYATTTVTRGFETLVSAVENVFRVI